MTVNIENISPKLLDEIYEIEKLSFKREAFSKQQISYLLKDYNTISLAAKIGNKIIGFVIGEMETANGRVYGHILTLETLPSYRRKGVAEKLLKTLEELFFEKGAGESHLEVRESNSAAISLYQKLGYKKTDRLEKYYGDAHGLYLKKKLIRYEG